MGTLFLIHDDYPPKAHLPGHGPIQGWLMTLRQLGLIVWYFLALTMHFTVNDKLITL